MLVVKMSLDAIALINGAFTLPDTDTDTETDKL